MYAQILDELIRCLEKVETNMFASLLLGLVSQEEVMVNGLRGRLMSYYSSCKWRWKEWCWKLAYHLSFIKWTAHQVYEILLSLIWLFSQSTVSIRVIPKHCIWYSCVLLHMYAVLCELLVYVLSMVHENLLLYNSWCYFFITGALLDSIHSVNSLFY